MLMQLFRKPALSASAVKQIQINTGRNMGIKIPRIETEHCFYIEVTEALYDEEFDILKWLLSETFEPLNLKDGSFVQEYPTQLEVGPRLNFETTWSSTATSIFHACGLHKVQRAERSLRFGLPRRLTPEQEITFLAPLHDRMTEMPYSEPLKTFESGLKAKPVKALPLIQKGISVLRKINKELGLAMDEQSQEMCYDLFVNILKRNPTDVEVFQWGASTSEHCRHGFFTGKLIIHGKAMNRTLMDIVKSPWKANPGNSVIAFHDDSSAIRGNEITVLVPENPGYPSRLVFKTVTYNPTCTAETHNFPSGVDPFPGAATGTGGRIRDNQAVGRGGLVIAGAIGYCVDNLHILGYVLPWEDKWKHSSDLASPLEILIKASDGASDYGNKFGEPVTHGFARSCGVGLPDGRRGWFKPILYTAGDGQIDDRHTKKGLPEKGMLVVQVGGKGFRLAVGGGSASSLMQGENKADLDFKAVQRGNPLEEQKVNRGFRACIEKGDNNPIISARDLGAVGDLNAITELINPAGGKINLREIPCGDKTLSVLEIWGNESQERQVLLVWPDRFDEIKGIFDNEKVTCVIVGQITGDGWLILHDENDGTTPVKLPLKNILGELPQKTFELKRIPPKRIPLTLPEDLTIMDGLDRIFRLVSAGSKEFLTGKVDRSVTGLIAQQQCVGPNHLTVSDYAVLAQSHFGLTGTVGAIGEQPLVGLNSPEAMARMAIGEALSNSMGAHTTLEDIKFEANCMLAAKLPGEGAWLYDAYLALEEICLELGIAADGGKDSDSMAAKTMSPDGDLQMVKAPGQLVIKTYAPMKDIRCKVTPDLKGSGNQLILIDLGQNKYRLGSSVLAQCFKQVGNDCPDIEKKNFKLLASIFKTVQRLVKNGSILSIHDRSDDGLITTLSEMAFAGNVGLNIETKTDVGAIKFFFSGEFGVVIECKDNDLVRATLRHNQIPFQVIGKVAPKNDLWITIQHNEEQVLREPMVKLRDLWQSTSDVIDARQRNPRCVSERIRTTSELITPPMYQVSFDAKPTPRSILCSKSKPKIAILRAEGSNGDREMSSMFKLSGFNTYDINMEHLLSGQANLDGFKGVAFVGGFTYADTLDAAKGWAGVIRFNKRLKDQFQQFHERTDTFSFGVCNGCQLMALLGWIPGFGLSEERQPRFITNESEKFESRFSSIKILPGPAIMLKDMEDSILGVWVAHGEGQLYLPDHSLYKVIDQCDLAPIRFVDSSGEITQTYPFNPNGSPDGITALCSQDGRHLAMMPHPERTFLKWQWPWMNSEIKKQEVSPWMKIGQNAREWCEQS